MRIRGLIFTVLSLVALIALASAPAHAQSITCSSDNGHRQYCAADTRGGVQMVRQRSDARCVQNSTWGYDRRGIWVDRGCRADFVVNQYNNGRYGNGYGNNRPMNRPGMGGPVQGQVITCSSDNGRRNVCPISAGRGVQLVRQRSDAQCIQGSTWGYSRSGIWVDRGCRADFSVR